MLGIFHANGSHDHPPERKLVNPGRAFSREDDDLIFLDTEF